SFSSVTVRFILSPVGIYQTTTTGDQTFQNEGYCYGQVSGGVCSESGICTTDSGTFGVVDKSRKINFDSNYYFGIPRIRKRHNTNEVVYSSGKAKTFSF